MASCSTSSSQPGTTLPELPVKLRPFESMCFEDCFSASNLDTEYNDCVSTDLKRLAATDKKLLEWVPIFEAQKRIKTAMRMFLKEEAERIKQSFEEYKSKGKDEGKDSEDSDSVDGEHDEVQVFIPPHQLVLLEDKAALTKLEVRSFVFKIWERRIQFTRKEDLGKYKSFQDFEHAIHNAQESIKHCKDFIYSQRYNREELHVMLSYHEDRLDKASNKTLQEKEKAGFEMLDEDVAIFCSNRARICALLGLQLDFLDRFDEIPPEDHDHFPLSDWIVIFLSNNCESVDSIDKNCLTEDLLAAIGFDPMSSAVETIMARAGSTQHHIEACEMAELYIRDEFKYNPLLSSMAGRFPFLSDLTNSWFQLPPSTTDEKEKESNEDLCHVNIINLVAEESHATTIQSMFSDLVSEDEQNVALFHGTDHQSASDILFRGIDLCAGRQKRDFSCGSGFYLTDNFDEALNWANNTTAKPAILIFRVNRREQLDDARKLNLYENGEKWHEIVSSFRSGKRTAKTRKSLIEYDLIEGPAATITRNESGELLIEQKPSSYQMCLISDDFADTFRETLHSVMFLDMC